MQGHSPKLKILRICSNIPQQTSPQTQGPLPYTLGCDTRYQPSILFFTYYIYTLSTEFKGRFAPGRHRAGISREKDSRTCANSRRRTRFTPQHTQVLSSWSKTDYLAWESGNLLSHQPRTDPQAAFCLKVGVSSWSTFFFEIFGIFDLAAVQRRSNDRRMSMTVIRPSS